MQNIILLHGALGNSKDLEGLAGYLEQSGLRVHLFSFSGHGKIPFETNFGIGQFSRELETFVTTHQLIKPTVFGYSMGGYVALNLAVNQKDLLGKIITLGTKFNWSEASVAKETKLLDAATILEKVPAFAKTLEEKHGDTWKELLLATAEMMREIGRSNFLNIENFSSIGIPVLIGIADKDQMVSLEETITTFKALPNAGMYMLPNSKHPIDTANLSLLSSIITGFVNRDTTKK